MPSIGLYERLIYAASSHAESSVCCYGYRTRRLVSDVVMG